MLTITRLTGDDFHERLPELARLLVDAVEGGHSLGFVAPFDAAEAREWWQGRYDAVAAGTLAVWLARDAGGAVGTRGAGGAVGARDAGGVGAGSAVGTVSLAFDGKANGRHRGDIVKLMVHREARGQGYGRRLLSIAEEAAAEAGLTLLMLDTEAGSAAETLYDKAGWTRYGVVPEYAADPAGVLQPCSFFYKQVAV
ncbi:GNAT family N-acetyltransferase [Kribbella deserti]|uniref:GNAT family N-acetyltransferase n=1 Tax=Kribbella deserti TaxID=1926257 RepID=A0ABV6QK32_9ACTN